MGCKDDEGNQIDKFWGMSNPPDMDTFWEKYLSNPPENAAVFIQPSGLSPEADWLQYLKDDYYDNLAEGKSQDYIDVYIHAKFGKSLSGQPVFRAFDSQVQQEVRKIANDAKAQAKAAVTRLLVEQLSK